ncbi:unnamed protein product [Withania somnifera]
MAKAISRNQQIRSLYRSISSYSSQQCRSTKPSFRLFHTLSNTPTTTKSLPLSPLAMRLGGLDTGFICYRLLCTSTSNNQSNSGSTNTGNRESSGGSYKTEQGKSSRGSPVSWMSFFLLVCTGAGLVYYYDREKKRHIEEKTSGIEIVPVFISVDPERDTVEQVGEYVKEFHPNLIGLTGTPEEIKKTARAYRVYYMKTEEEGSDYLVDHSIVMYLMDPKMDFVKFFGKNNDVDMLADGIIKEIKQYKRVKA